GCHMEGLAALARSGRAGCPTWRAARSGLETARRRERHLYLAVPEQLDLGLLDERCGPARSCPLQRRYLHGILNAGLLVMDQWFRTRVPHAPYRSGQRSPVLPRVAVWRTLGSSTVPQLERRGVYAEVLQRDLPADGADSSGFSPLTLGNAPRSPVGRASKIAPDDPMGPRNRNHDCARELALVRGRLASTAPIPRPGGSHWIYGRNRNLAALARQD